MKLHEIKQAVEAGKTVHWANSLYIVVKDKLGQWFVKCTSNNHYIGLTHRDGVTLGDREDKFYIAS